jgi:hypothetical protein
MGTGEERGVNWPLSWLARGSLSIEIPALLAKLVGKPVFRTCNLGKSFCPLLHIHRTSGQNWCTPWKHSSRLCLGAATHSPSSLLPSSYASSISSSHSLFLFFSFSLSVFSLKVWFFA